MGWLAVPPYKLGLPTVDFLCYIFGLYLTSYVGVAKKKERFYQTGMSHDIIHMHFLKKGGIQKFKHSAMKLFLVEVPEYSNSKCQSDYSCGFFKTN